MFDEGIEALRGVLADVGMSFPDSQQRALFSFAWNRSLLRLRGLKFRERPAEEISSAELQRIDLCWSVASGLAVVDTLRATHFQAKHLLRMARALSLEAGLAAAPGGHGAARAGRIAATANELARRVNQPYALAWARGSLGVAAALCGRWSAGVVHCKESEAIFRAQCGGIAWELATIQLFTISCLYYLGRVDELARRTPASLREAEERGDRYLATCYWTLPGITAWLAADDLSGAREQARLARSYASTSPFHVGHLWNLIASRHVDLYAADAGTHARIAAEWSRVQSPMARVQLLRIEALFLRARAALVAAQAQNGAARALVGTARRDARAVTREQMPWAQPLALLVEAGAAHLERDDARATAHLRAAAEQLDGAEMPLFAACARRRLGQLLGGDEGRALADTAEAWMRDEGIRNPARMTAMLAPGFAD
jgi:hypothetical protein